MPKKVIKRNSGQQAAASARTRSRASSPPPASSPPRVAEETQSDASVLSCATVVWNDRNTSNNPSTSEGVVDEEHAGTSDISVIAPVNGKRWKKKSAPVILTDADEQKIAEWIETEGHYLFDKGHVEYKNVHKIAKAFHDLGQSLEPPISGPEVRKWFQSNRSRFSRLTLMKSGAGATRRLSEREKWIITIFNFLKPHIVRYRKTTVVGFQTVSTITQ